MPPRPLGSGALVSAAHRARATPPRAPAGWGAPRGGRPHTLAGVGRPYDVPRDVDRPRLGAVSGRLGPSLSGRSSPATQAHAQSPFKKKRPLLLAALESRYLNAS